MAGSLVGKVLNLMGFEETVVEEVEVTDDNDVISRLEPPTEIDRGRP